MAKLIPFCLAFATMLSSVLSTPPAQRSQLAAGETKFATDLFQSVYQSNRNRNILISPYSVYRALLLAYLAADGDTERSLTRALHLDWARGNKDQVYAAFVSDGEADASRQQQGVAKISVADRLFVDQGTVVE